MENKVLRGVEDMTTFSTHFSEEAEDEVDSSNSKKFKPPKKLLISH